MASANLSRRVEKVVHCPPRSDLGDLQRREFHEALLEAATFEDLPGKWQAEGGAEPAAAPGGIPGLDARERTRSGREAGACMSSLSASGSTVDNRPE
jgi:hypothetical protein